MERRQFLGGMAALGAAAALQPRVALDLASRALTLRDAVRRPGSRPYPNKPEGIDTIPKIKHIVIVMMENHSFDNYLGHLGRGDGAKKVALPDEAGNLVRPFHMPSTCQLDGTPNVGWDASHASLANNDNTGFVRASGPVAMGYWTRDDLPFYDSLARTFTVCDRWFASCLGPTYPNRRFMQAGTAAGLTETRLSSINDPLPAAGVIFEQLDAHGISWTNYYSDLPSVGLFVQYARQHQDRLKKIDQLFVDARAGSLSDVVLIDPAYVGGESEENPADVRKGEAFVSRVTKAILESAAWPHTVMLWVYDEHGGYYDHVVPPPAIEPDSVLAVSADGRPRGRYDRYGFRVPAVVVSPFARRRHVSHTVRDHTSMLKLIETKWNLPALTYRDANADDLLDTLDLHGRPAFAEPPELAAPALDRDSTACSLDASAIPPADALTPARK